MSKTSLPTPEIKAVSKEKTSYLPKIMLLFGVLLVAVAVIDYLNLLSINKIILDIALLLAGLWIVKIAFEQGLYKRRKELLKKYI